MSLQVIRNGLVAHLATCGPWLAAEISTCDFGILESVSACAIMLTPGRDTRIEPIAFGSQANRRQKHRYWDVAGRLYVRDTGDPKRLLSLCWQGCDDLHDTLTKDDSLGGSACAAGMVSLGFDAQAAAEWQGVYYAVINFRIVAEEF